MKILNKIIVVVSTFFILFILSGIFIAHFYGKEITRYIIAEISQSLNADIEIGEVQNLSLFEKFPFASVALNNTFVKEISKRKNSKDTLFFAQKIHLQFNLLDIFQSDYKIRRISISDGFAHLKVDKKGNENYLIQSKLKGENDKVFLIKLSRLNISDFKIVYENEFKEQFFKIHCSQAVAKGDFSNEKFLLNTEGDFFSENMKTEDIEFFQNRKIALKTELDVDNSKKIYAVKNGEITIDEKMKFDVSGNLLENPERVLNSFGVELKISSKNLSISSALELLPQKQREKFAEYQSAGTVNFECKINGEFSNEKTPSIAAAFSIENGTLSRKNTSYSLEKIFLNGSFSNGKHKNPSSSIIEINKFKANLGKGNIIGKIAVSNLNAPQIKLSANARISLEELKKIFPIDAIENVSGEITANIQYEGALKNSEDFFAKDFQNAKSNGEINFENVNFTLKNNPLSYQKFSGNLFLRNNDVLVQNFRGNISSSDFELNGIFRNALAYLFLPEEKLIVEASFLSNNLNLNELLEANKTSPDTSYLLGFPEKINFNLNAGIARFSFRKFTASDISGIITVKNKILRSENIFFKAMNGTLNGNFEIDASDNHSILISSINKISNVDIHQLFRDFENFGQNAITEKHLKGAASAEMQFVMMMDSALNIDENKIYALADLTIENGELINYEPMNEISRFMKNHIFLKRLIKTDEFEKKLKHIKFSSLRNQIEIKDRKIIIPTMKINSSAMNIEAEGNHSFDNFMDYKINFFLSELLTQKDEVSKDEFGEIEDDGTGKKKIFLTIKGNPENPEISYDKKKVKKNIQAEVQKEKQTIKQIIKEEFGFFKKDSIASIEKKKKKDDFMIEWDDGNKSATDSSQSAKNKKEKNLKFFFHNLNKEEKKPHEFSPDEPALEKSDDF